MLSLTTNYHLSFAIMFNDVKQTYEIKNLIKVEHFLWCSPLVRTWLIIVKVWGSILYTYNLRACLEG
jgi:hypothetical protein